MRFVTRGESVNNLSNCTIIPKEVYLGEPTEEDLPKKKHELSRKRKAFPKKKK